MEQNQESRGEKEADEDHTVVLQCPSPQVQLTASSPSLNTTQPTPHHHQPQQQQQQTFYQPSATRPLFTSSTEAKIISSNPEFRQLFNRGFSPVQPQTQINTPVNHTIAAVTNEWRNRNMGVGNTTQWQAQEPVVMRRRVSTTTPTLPPWGANRTDKDASVGATAAPPEGSSVAPTAAPKKRGKAAAAVQQPENTPTPEEEPAANEEGEAPTTTRKRGRRTATTATTKRAPAKRKAPARKKAKTAATAATETSPEDDNGEGPSTTTQQPPLPVLNPSTFDSRFYDYNPPSQQQPHSGIVFPHQIPQSQIIHGVRYTPTHPSYTIVTDASTGSVRVFNPMEVPGSNRLHASPTQGQGLLPIPSLAEIISKFRTAEDTLNRLNRGDPVTGTEVDDAVEFMARMSALQDPARGRSSNVLPSFPSGRFTTFVPQQHQQQQQHQQGMAIAGGFAAITPMMGMGMMTSPIMQPPGGSGMSMTLTQPMTNLDADFAAFVNSGINSVDAFTTEQSQGVVGGVQNYNISGDPNEPYAELSDDFKLRDEYGREVSIEEYLRLSVTPEPEEPVAQEEREKSPAVERSGQMEQLDGTE